MFRYLNIEYDKRGRNIVKIYVNGYNNNEDVIDITRAPNEGLWSTRFANNNAFENKGI